MRPRLSSILLVASLAAACAPEVGECDRVAAREIVYTAEGTPAFAGQALIIQSCGGGGFCHAEGIELSNRFGVPAGLSFDLRPGGSSEAELERLDRDQLRVLRHHAAILEQVERGAMPPPAGSEALEEVYDSSPRYERVGEDGAFTPLPEIGSEEGLDILRNWLACGAPVVERTTPRSEGGNTIGFTVAACPRRCVDPSWPDIAQQILVPTCASSACHDADQPGGGLDLSVDASDPAALSALHERLTSGTATGRQCVDSAVADAPMIAPHDPEGSLLIQKITPELLACGSLMPLSGALGAQRRCALREWVACGACADPGDEACAACRETARATCGVIMDAASGEPACMEQVACPRYLAQ